MPAASNPRKNPYGFGSNKKPIPNSSKKPGSGKVPIPSRKPGKPGSGMRPVPKKTK